MPAPTYVTQSNATELTRLATGQFTTADTTTASITLGFQPRYIKIIDETTQEEYVWIEAMGTTDIHQRIDNGTSAMDTTQIITASETGFTFVPKASKTYDWAAFG